MAPLVRRRVRPPDLPTAVRYASAVWLPHSSVNVWLTTFRAVLPVGFALAPRAAQY